MDKEIRDRIRALKAMNTLATLLNDENFYYNHWIYIIPDGADDEELEDIAENDIDTFTDAVKCFNEHYGRYAKHGLYIGRELYN